MKKLIQTTMTLLFCLALLPAAYAVTLQEAKAEGLVGEQRNGYLGLVVNDVSDEVRVLVEEVNNLRRQRYLQIARENSIDEEQVAALAFDRAVAATVRGHFIQNAGGAWIRKP